MRRTQKVKKIAASGHVHPEKATRNDPPEAQSRPRKAKPLEEPNQETSNEFNRLPPTPAESITYPKHLNGKPSTIKHMQNRD
jgi:hypothetical protein